MSLLDGGGLFGGAIQGAQGLTTAQVQAMNAQNQLARQQQQAYNSAYQNQLAMQGIQAGQTVPGPQQSFNPNKMEAYQIPLSQLITLWQAKFGEKWVNDSDLFESKDQFFATAADRLKANNLFEKIAGWYRLKEDL